MFDLSAAKELSAQELDISMPKVYDYIRKAIRDGSPSVLLSIGVCQRGNCNCEGTITELQLGRLQKQKYHTNEEHFDTMQGFEVNTHYTISGWLENYDS